MASRIYRSGGLPGSILRAMNEYDVGDQWNTQDIIDALPGVGWETRSTPANVRIQVANALGTLVESKHVRRPRRGTYVLSKSGSNRATELTSA